MVARRSPIVEIGAGSGYWAMCLSQLGADVIAYDRHPPEEGTPWWEPANPWFEREWFQVREGDAECARHHPDRSLLLCWPPPGNPMAAAALSMYRDAGGHTLIYIGDRASSGDHEFHSVLGEMSAIVNRRLWGWWAWRTASRFTPSGDVKRALPDKGEKFTAGSRALQRAIKSVRIVFRYDLVLTVDVNCRPVAVAALTRHRVDESIHHK